jgi:hypothetical protein
VRLGSWDVPTVVVVDLGVPKNIDPLKRSGSAAREVATRYDIASTGDGVLAVYDELTG